MRVAVCISGQPRLHRSCLENIVEVFSKGKPENVYVDFFIHTWDYISGISGDVEKFYVEPSKVRAILKETFNPVKLEIEHWDKTLFGLGQPFLSAFYSLRKSLKLWSNYSESTGTEYDWVFYTRLDDLRVQKVEEIYETYAVSWDLLPDLNDQQNRRAVYHFSGSESGSIKFVSWLDERPHSCFEDFSWFATPAAARVLQELYTFWFSIVYSPTVDWFYSHPKECKIEFDNAESRWAIFAAVTGILDLWSNAYWPGAPVRMCLNDYNLSSPKGKDLFNTLIETYGWFYTPETLKKMPEFQTVLEKRPGLIKKLKLVKRESDESNFV